MAIREFESQTKELIDSLKAVCANFGLGNSASEFTIISQVFLYKFLNDKFAHEIKKNTAQNKKIIFINISLDQ